MDNQSPHVNDEREYPHWGRVYVIVIIFTVIVIIGLWAFSKLYE